MLTVLVILAIAALVTAIAALAGKLPVTVPVFILAVVACLQLLPTK